MSSGEAILPSELEVTVFVGSTWGYDRDNDSYTVRYLGELADRRVAIERVTGAIYTAFQEATWPGTPTPVLAIDVVPQQEGVLTFWVVWDPEAPGYHMVLDIVVLALDRLRA